MENFVKFIKIDNFEFRTILDKFRTLKYTFNNFYNYYSDSSDVEVYIGSSTLLIRKYENGFYRCYIISADYHEIVQLLRKLDFEHAISVPTKKTIDEWGRLLMECGYTCVGAYERMYYTEVKIRTNRAPIYADKLHLYDIYNFLYSSFDKILDHLPSLGTLARMIDNKQVIMSQTKSINPGFLIYEIKEKKCYLNAWLDKSGEGLLLLFDVFNIIKYNGINYSYFWVNSTNLEVKKIHQLLGAKYDGLKDYTFIKKT